MARKDELTRRADAARQGILRRRLVDLSQETLERIQVRLQDERGEVVTKLEKLHARTEDHLDEGDLPSFEDAKTRAVDLTTELSEVEERLQRVHDARQERILNDRMIAKLGSRMRFVLYDTFIMTLIVLVVGLLITMEVVELPTQTRIIMGWVDVGACVIFLGDFFWRHSMAESKRWFWKRFWLDFITSIPLPDAQALRLGRMVRLARLLRVMQLARILRIVLFFWRGMDKLAATFDVKMMRRSMRILLLVLLLGGIGIFMAEGHEDTEGVESFAQSLWWSFTTVVTGGFGDIHNPQTLSGRLITIALIVAGMVVVGIFTATLTSLLVRENDASGAIMELEEKMSERLSEIQAQIGRADAE
ncbi:MAG: ion transporter [Myxococcota bacterium]